MDSDNKKSILLEAEEIVNGARKSDYGSAKESFEKIAELTSLLLTKDEWNSLAAGVIQPTVPARMLQAVKLVRESYVHKRDNGVDLAGYTKILQDLIEE